MMETRRQAMDAVQHALWKTASIALQKEEKPAAGPARWDPIDLKPFVHKACL
jgi:hypothetical protein